MAYVAVTWPVSSQCLSRATNSGRGEVSVSDAAVTSWYTTWWWNLGTCSSLRHLVASSLSLVSTYSCNNSSMSRYSSAMVRKPLRQHFFSRMASESLRS